MRHGYSEKNEQKILAGKYPEKVEYKLLPKGVKQAQASAQKFKKENIDIILASPLKANKTNRRNCRKRGRRKTAILTNDS